MKSVLFFTMALYCLMAGNLRAATTDPLQNRVISDDRTPHSPLDTPIGNIYLAGTSWYDLQHNATEGKMIAVDSAGYAHVVWMKAADQAASSRHVYYNNWNPNTQTMTFGGVGTQVDGSNRAGFTSVAVLPSGFAFPAFHQTNGGSTVQMAGAMDFLARAGAFTTTQPAYIVQEGLELSCVWPKIAVDGNGVIHSVCTSSSLGSVYYSRGVPEFIEGFGIEIDWQVVDTAGLELKGIDSTLAVTPDIAASKTSSRVAIAYARPRVGGFNLDLLNSDLYLCLSEDGGVTWNAPTNLTQFMAEDSQRTFSEVSVVIDEDDNVHVAFVTNFYWESAPGVFITSSYRSRIWHWGEATGEFNVIASDWTEGNFLPGAGKRNLAIPNLSVDPLTGNLFCSYQKFDNTSGSEMGYAASDAWVTVSTDGGNSWSIGRNVTDTTPPVNPAPAGESLNERDITLSDRVTYSGGLGYLHLFWELDQDAGSWLNGEGGRYDNPFYYQRFTVDEIPLTPLVPQMELHDGVAPVDDLTIIIEPANQGYMLNWTPAANANQYRIYRSETLNDLFDETNFQLAVGDTFYVCSNCLSVEQEYLGVIAVRVIELARPNHVIALPTVSEPLR